MKEQTTDKIPFIILDQTEEQLYILRDVLTDEMEEQTWKEVNQLIDKIQSYKIKFYGGTGSVFNPEKQ